MLKVKLHKISRAQANYGMPSDLIGEYAISEVVISRGMKETTHFNFSINLQDIDSSFPAANTELIHCLVYKLGVLLVHGIVGSFERNDDKIDVECEDVLFLLTQAAARPFPIYKNRHVPAILHDMIRYSPTFNLNYKNAFRLKNFYTLENPVDVSTLDVREEERLFSQITKIIDNNPDIYIRYGGYGGLYFDNPNEYPATDLRTQWFYYDIGVFDTNMNFVYDFGNIEELEIENNTHVQLGAVVPFGGNWTNALGVINPINIDHLIYGSFTLNPNYTAVLGIGVFNGIYTYGAVYDTDIYPDGFNQEHYEIITKRYDVELEIPSMLASPPLVVADIAEAAYQLYKCAVKDLRRAKKNKQFIKLTSSEFPEGIMPGNIIQINYNVSNQKYDLINDKPMTQAITNLVLNGNYYVQSYELTYSLDGNKIEYVLNSTGTYHDKNPEKLRLNPIREARKNKEFFDKVDTFEYGYYNVTLSGLAANGGGGVGYTSSRQTTFDRIVDADFGEIGVSHIPDYSSNIVGVYICSDNPDMEYDFTWTPAGTTLDIYVFNKNSGTWDNTMYADVKILIAYE